MSFNHPYRKPFISEVGPVTIANTASSNAGDFEYENAGGTDLLIKKLQITGGAAVIDTITVDGVTITVSEHTAETTEVDLEAVFGFPVSLRPGSKVDAIVSNNSGASLNITLQVVGVKTTIQ